MKIHLRQIRPEGIELEEAFPPEWIGQTQEDVVQFTAPVQVKAGIARADEEVLATVAVRGRYESFCNRCLEDMKRDWAVDFTLVFDIDRYVEFIEMDEDIRQELILNLPARILCREDCKGLCVDCGVNLNNRECPHKHAVVSSQS